MKRVLAAIAALLIAGTAEARTLIAMDRHIIGGTASNNTKEAAVSENSLAFLRGFIDHFNPNSYDVVYLGSLKPDANGHPTEQLRIGLVNGVQYSAVIYPNITAVVINGRSQPACWPCSLTYVAKHPTVPQLFIAAGLNETRFSTGNTVAVRCSTGAAGDQMDPSTQGPGYGLQRNVLIGTNYTWTSFGCPGVRIEPATFSALSGSARVIVGAGANCMFSGPGGDPAPNGTNNCSFRDSLKSQDASCSNCGGSGDGTGALVWAFYPNTSGAKPVVFCRWQSHAATGRGGLTGDETTIGGDLFSLFASLAFLDSLTSNDLLGTAKPNPLKIAFQVDGLGNEAPGANYFGGWPSSWSGGIEPSDTTALFATFDSISTRKIKLTFGADVIRGSVSGSAGWRQLYMAGRIPTARFTPQSWPKVVGHAGALGGAHFRHPIDQFGISRNRTFYGPVRSDVTSSDYAADTSLAALSIGAYFLIDSIFGPGRRGYVAMPPFGNWAINSMTTNQNVDSLVYALKSAGFSGVSSDAEGDTLSSATGYPRAIGSGQRVRSNRLGDGSPFMFLTHPGRSLVSLNTHSDYLHSSNEFREGAEIYRALAGLVTNRWLPNEAFLTKTGELGTHGENGQITSGQPGFFGGVSDNANTLTGTNIVRIGMADLGSGERQAGTSSADRPGYWMMVHIKNGMDAVNHIGGRSLMQIVWDHEIGPQDIRR